MILFIILGIILLIVSFTLKSNVNPFSKFATVLKFFGILLIVLGVFSSMFKQIDAGKVGVKSLYGSVQPDVLESG
jgi:uncharacterized membrane protein HdeD (DUF308 family)